MTKLAIKLIFVLSFGRTLANASVVVRCAGRTMNHALSDLDFCCWPQLLKGLYEMNADDADGSLDQTGAQFVLHKREKRSCAERRKHETQDLLEQIEQLQNELELLTGKRQSAFARTQDEWEDHIDQQVGARTRARHRNIRLRQHVAQEMRKCARRNVLLRKMIAPMEASAFFAVEPTFLSKTKRDDAIINALERRIRAKHEAEQNIWLLNAISLDSDDVVDVALSHDGLLTEHRHARVMPFDVSRIDEALWQWNIVNIYTSENAQNVSKSSDMLTFKQEVNMKLLGSTLHLWTLVKRFVSEHGVVIRWEAVYDWLSASGEISASTRESGSATIQSVVQSAYLLSLDETSSTQVAPISVLRAFVQITRSDFDHLHLIQSLLKSGSLTNLVLPSLPQVMVDRAQRVENQLMAKPY